MQLFEANFDFAVIKCAYSILWKVQKTLFGKVRAQYEDAKTKAFLKGKKKKKNNTSVYIAKIVSFCS